MCKWNFHLLIYTMLIYNIPCIRLQKKYFTKKCTIWFISFGLNLFIFYNIKNIYNYRKEKKNTEDVQNFLCCFFFDDKIQIH